MQRKCFPLCSLPETHHYSSRVSLCSPLALSFILLPFLFLLLSFYWCPVFSALFSDFRTLISECLGWTTWREQQLTLWRGTNLWLTWIYETIRWQIWIWAPWAAWSSCTASGISWKSWRWVASPCGPSMQTATVRPFAFFTFFLQALGTN